MIHWKAVKHLFWYLKGTIDYKLTYSPSSDNELFTSYTDADHAGCVELEFILDLSEFIRGSTTLHNSRPFVSLVHL